MFLKLFSNYPRAVLNLHCQNVVSNCSVYAAIKVLILRQLQCKIPLVNIRGTNKATTTTTTTAIIIIC